MMVLVFVCTSCKLEHMLFMNLFIFCPALALNQDSFIFFLQYEVASHIFQFANSTRIGYTIALQFTEISNITLVLDSDLPGAFLALNITIKGELKALTRRQLCVFFRRKILLQNFLILLRRSRRRNCVLKSLDRGNFFKIKEPWEKCFIEMQLIFCFLSPYTPSTKLLFESFLHILYFFNITGFVQKLLIYFLIVYTQEISIVRSKPRICLFCIMKKTIKILFFFPEGFVCGMNSGFFLQKSTALIQKLREVISEWSCIHV